MGEKEIDLIEASYRTVDLTTSSTGLWRSTSLTLPPRLRRQPSVRLVGDDGADNELFDDGCAPSERFQRRTVLSSSDSDAFITWSSEKKATNAAFPLCPRSTLGTGGPRCHDGGRSRRGAVTLLAPALAFEGGERKGATPSTGVQRLGRRISRFRSSIE